MAISQQQKEDSGIIRPMTTISLRTLVLRGISATAALAGLFGLYYGMVMSFLVPGYPGESFFTVSRFTYGVLPLLTGVVLVFFAAWIWKCTTETDFPVVVKRFFIGAFGALALFWTVLIIIAKVTGRIP
jgi:hypothetical protein